VVIEGRLVGGVRCVVVEGGRSVHMTMARWFKREGPCSLLWGDDRLERSANERLTGDSTLATSVVFDVTPRQDAECEGWDQWIRPGRRNRESRRSNLRPSHPMFLANEHCGLLQPVGCASARVL
jgi:hypothetical protein